MRWRSSRNEGFGEARGMDLTKDIIAARNLIASSYEVSDQLKAREILKTEPESYDRTIAEAYLYNPVLRLTEDEAATLKRRVRIEAVGQLIAMRHAVTRSPSPKYVVFCMPKSGSSFIKSALMAALELPFVSLTSVGAPRSSSEFGMNSREQELDELAVVKSALLHPDGLIAQHHTRYSLYLALQMQLYGIIPIVTFRNILDCMVSFDDMMYSSKINGNSWTLDPQFILPINYKELDAETRYTILAHSYGTWLINFYLSWKRSHHHQFVSPLFIRYEEHVLDREALIGLLSGCASMSEEQEQRLRKFVHEPDRAQSRFNVGRSGRGAEKVPERLQAFLADYAGMYRSELTEDDIRYLVR
jgi:hypothetical protein